MAARHCNREAAEAAANNDTNNNYNKNINDDNITGIGQQTSQWMNQWRLVAALEMLGGWAGEGGGGVGEGKGGLVGGWDKKKIKKSVIERGMLQPRPPSYLTPPSPRIKQRR